MEDKVKELLSRIEELEIELKKEKLRSNNFQIIAQHAIRDKRIISGQLSALRKIKSAHEKYNKLSNDEVMQKLRSFWYGSNSRSHN